MSFLEKGYKVPQDKGNYYKFKQGDNHKYIDETKGRLKMATRLNEIINSYKKDENNKI